MCQQSDAGPETERQHCSVFDECSVLKVIAFDNARSRWRSAMRPSEALHHHRDAIRRIVESHRTRDVRVFGSVARGGDTEQSDLDLLVDPTPRTTLFDMGAGEASRNRMRDCPHFVSRRNGRVIGDLATTWGCEPR